MGGGGGSGLEMLFNGRKETEERCIGVAIVVVVVVVVVYIVAGGRGSGSKIGFVVKGGRTKQQVNMSRIRGREISTRLKVFCHGAPNRSSTDRSDGRREPKGKGSTVDAVAGGELLQRGKESLLTELGCGQTGQKERFGTSRRRQRFTSSRRVVLVKRIRVTVRGGRHRITGHDDHRGWGVLLLLLLLGGRGKSQRLWRTKRIL